MQSKSSSNNNSKTSFDLKIHNYWLLLIAVITTWYFFAFLYKLVFKNKGNGFTNILVVVSLLFLANYLFLLFFKPKTVLKISDQGVWTKDEGWIEWNNIKSFYIQKNFIRNHIYLSLFLCLNNTDTEISVVISDDRLIRKNLQLYKGDRKIVDMGNKEQVFDRVNGKIINQSWHLNK